MGKGAYCQILQSDFDPRTHIVERGGKKSISANSPLPSTCALRQEQAHAYSHRISND